MRSDAYFIVRIDGINPASHGLNRQLEWRVLQIASAAKLAPTPRYFNPELGCLVCDYLTPDPLPGVRHEHTAQLLQDIHALPPLRQKLNLRERILRYEKQLQQIEVGQPDGLLALGNSVMEIARSAADSCTTLTVCHNDLLRANRLYSGGRLYALDWEYCAMADPLYDLAVLIAGDELNAAERKTLVESYLQRPANDAELLRLNQYDCVYRYLELLWYSVAGVELDDKATAEKLEKLLAAIDARPI